jgi:hypothetical protein
MRVIYNVIMRKCIIQVVGGVGIGTGIASSARAAVARMMISRIYSSSESESSSPLDSSFCSTAKIC